MDYVSLNWELGNFRIVMVLKMLLGVVMGIYFDSQNCFILLTLL